MTVTRSAASTPASTPGASHESIHDSGESSMTQNNEHQSNAVLEDNTPFVTCIAECKHSNSTEQPDDSSLIRCCLCGIIHHCDCVGVDEGVGVWPCYNCRLMPAQIKTMKDDISRLLQANDTLTQTLSHITKMLQAQSRSLGTDESDDEDNDDEFEEIQPEGVLIIGDSILRNVQSISDDIKVECYRGARLSDLKKHLKGINPKKKILKEIHIVCGTNDISTTRPNEKIVQDYKAVLQLATQRAETVHLSSILPRIDGKVDQTRIDTMNLLLVALTNELDVSFKLHDKNFKFQDDTVDQSLFLVGDGLHLSEQGVIKMLTNLGLKDKCKPDFGRMPAFASQSTNKYSFQNGDDDPKQGAWSKPPQKTPPPSTSSSNQNFDGNFTKQNTLLFRGHKNPLSNFYNAPIRIWNTSFPSTEHAYNYRKAIEMGQHATAERIRHAPNAFRAMKIAEDVMTDSRWTDMKQSVMYQLLQEKAKQSDTFHKFLENSSPKLLIEDTSHEYWGRGLAGQGLNMLGRLLMTLRESLHGVNKKPNVNNETDQVPFRAQINPAPPNYSNGLPKRLNDQLRCYNCGERSHTKDACRLPSPVQCYACLKNGHKQKFCRSNQKPPRSVHMHV